MLARAEQRKAFLSGESSDDTLPGAIRQLFPNRFVLDAEMGWIPEGWEYSNLGQLVSQRNERVTPSQETQNMHYVPIECISSKSLFLTESKSGHEAKSSLIKFYAGDILFGAMRPYFHKICIIPFDGTTRTTAFVLCPKREEDFAFSTLLLHQEKTVEYATAQSTGTTIPYAKWSKSLELMPIILPPVKVRTQFNILVKDLLLSIPPKYFCIESLQKMRDTLLPKLISGELRLPVPEAEDIHEQLHSAVV